MSTDQLSVFFCFLFFFGFVLIGLLYKAYPDGCQHRFTSPAEAKALPHEGASALVVCVLHQLISGVLLDCCHVPSLKPVKLSMCLVKCQLLTCQNPIII